MPAAVELRKITKRFGNVIANDAVDLQVQPGTIHGVIGENGAGKSTAMKMLYGIYSPDAGQIVAHGQPRVWSSPADAIAAGIGMVHQHFMLAGPYTALDNILLGAEPVRLGVIERKKARQRLEALSRQYELPVDLNKPVEELPVGVQQRVEILKLLYRDAQILILDEPTAVLTPQETNVLFQHLKLLRDEGKTIILITHKLKEVMAVTDRITVLRAGKVTGEMPTAQTNPQELASLMVGRKVSLSIDVAPGRPRAEVALEMPGLTVRCGEIVGIAGVEGNGQSELLQEILRRQRRTAIGSIPEDRQLEGLLLDRPVSENFRLGLHRSFSRTELLQAAAVAVEEYDVRPRDLTITARQLSGGNQQKLIVAREFYRQPKLLIAAQPTRGVDVGAIEFIHQRIVRARDDGAGVLLVSFELDEILTLSDRILVMYEGRIVAEFQRGQVSESKLGLKMAGS
jgi:general nucleoside transport system ATP-binding protein